MHNEPLIVFTNDDGIDSPWLTEAVYACKELGEPLICAPLNEQSSMGRAYARTQTSGRILNKDLVIDQEKYRAFAVDGSPALVVGHAIMEIAERRPALLVSGINPGENVGSTMTSSGTVMAALEASTFNVPAVAFSYQKSALVEPDREAILYHVERIAQSVLENSLPFAVSCLSVNLPADVSKDTQLKMTTLSQQTYYEYVNEKRSGVLSEPHHLKIELRYEQEDLNENSDIYCLLIEKKISVTPITWDITSRVQPKELIEHLKL